MDWTKEEQRDLLDKCLQMVGGKLTFMRSKAKIQWDKLDIPDKTAKECEDMFYSLTEEVRKHRIFSEIIDEAAAEITKGYSLKYCQDHFPDFPKKPLLPIQMYVADNPAEFEHVPRKDMFRVINQKWKDAPEETKEHYKAKCNKKKLKYHRKIDEFRKNHPGILIRGISSQRQLPAPALPKPAALYANSVRAKLRAKHPEMNANDVNKKCVSKYLKLSDKKKVKWILQAQEQLADYKVQCEAYLRHRPTAKLKPASLNLTKEEKRVLDVHEGKPVTPPLNLFRYFDSKIDLDPSLNIAVRSRQLSKLYHELPKSEMEQLRKEHKQVLQTYINEYSQYYESLSPERQQLEETNYANYKKMIVAISKSPKKHKKPTEEEENPSKKRKTEEQIARNSDISLPAVESPKKKSSLAVESPKKKSPKKEMNGELDLDDALLSFTDSTSPKKKAPKVKKKAEESEKDKLEAEVEASLAFFFSPLKTPRPEKGSPEEESSPKSPKKSKKSKKSKKEK